MEVERSADAVARRYRAKYRVQDVAFRVFDRILAAFITRAASPADWNPESVRRVLIANAGHFGDLVFSTAVIKRVRGGFPRATVGGFWPEAGHGAYTKGVRSSSTSTFWITGTRTEPGCRGGGKSCAISPNAAESLKSFGGSAMTSRST